MNTTSLPEKLILASSSQYRKKLLQRLGLKFSSISPEIDETPQAGESAECLVRRLADEKAGHIGRDYRDAIVIGSDQVAVFDGQVIGKPGSHDKAVEQLKAFSQQTVEFLTAVSVIHTRAGFSESYTDLTTVEFRSLGSGEIDRYLKIEKPYDCAGAFKAELLGIALFKRISSNDPTSLTGLPLIRTCEMLRKAGVLLP